MLQPPAGLVLLDRQTCAISFDADWQQNGKCWACGMHTVLFFFRDSFSHICSLFSELLGLYTPCERAYPGVRRSHTKSSGGTQLWPRLVVLEVIEMVVPVTEVVLVVTSTSDTYVGGWLCLRSPKSTAHSSCCIRGKASAVAARDPASMVLNSVFSRGLHTAWSWSAYPAPVGGYHHTHSCTCAHVFASGAARMPRGTSANVE